MRIRLEVEVETPDIERLQQIIAVQHVTKVTIPGDLTNADWELWGRLIGAKATH